MDKKSSTSIVLTKRQQFWLEHFRSCQVAGNRYSDYAKSHGLNLNTFYTMIRRLRRLGAVGKQPKKGIHLFKKIAVQSTVSTLSEVRLCFPNGVCIELNTHFDASTLPVLLQTVAQLK